MKKTLLLLCLIVLFAAFLRFYKLGINPPSLTWDEVAWGYNAYSLGIDGRDEFGRFLPHDYLESFGDFKPPVYAYLDIIPVKLFGLSEFAVRVPSALFGTLTVLATYFLVKSLFGEESEIIALFSSLFLAISPWHINLGRAAFEANVSSFFIVLGTWLFLEAVNRKKWLLFPAMISFVITLYTFNTARIVSPLLVIVLFLGFRKKLLTIKKELFLSCLFAFLLILPSLKFLFSDQARLRFREVNIFSDAGVVIRSNQEMQNDHNLLWSKLIHNRRLAYGVEYVRHYLDNLNPQFLFFKGDGNPKFSTQEVGEMYLFDIPFFVAGAILLFKQKRKAWWVVPVWLLIGILPAATARETPHALRIETTLPTFQIITALGFASFISKLSKVRMKNGLLTLFFIFLFFNFLYYYHGYYAHYPRIYSGEWQYGYKDSIEYVRQNEDKYERISVTNELGRPYIYYLFYTKTNPLSFRKNSDVKRDVFGFVTVMNFGKYSFGKDPNDLKKLRGKTLFINTPNNIPGNSNVLKTFYLLNGNPVLVAYTL